MKKNTADTLTVLFGIAAAVGTVAVGMKAAELAERRLPLLAAQLEDAAKDLKSATGWRRREALARIQQLNKQIADALELIGG